MNRRSVPTGSFASLTSCSVKCGGRVPLSLLELPACSTCSRRSRKSDSRFDYVR